MRLVVYIFITFFCLSSFAKVNFSNNCGDGEHLLISFVGDLIMHSPLQRKAADNKDFSSLWQEVIPYFLRSDLSYANLETAVADGVGLNNKETTDPGHVYDKNVYTTYPRFNTHPQLIESLLESGIDVVSTANNHSLDRGSLGVDKTIANLDKYGLKYTGTRKKNDKDSPWYTITQQNGFSIAWLSCAHSTNGIPDNYKQVLSCSQDENFILQMITQLRQSNDAVVMLPHWGEESKTNPNQRQKRWAKLWLDQGATLVIGSHPHVLQPVEKYITKDGRETLIAYSLGNFTTFHYDVKQKSSVVLFVNFERGDNGDLVINGVRYLPLFMRNRTGWYMDVKVRPLLSDNSYKGKGYEDLDLAIETIKNIFGYTNGIWSSDQNSINYSHCNSVMFN